MALLHACGVKLTARDTERRKDSRAGKAATPLFQRAGWGYRAELRRGGFRAWRLMGQLMEAEGLRRLEDNGGYARRAAVVGGSVCAR